MFKFCFEGYEVIETILKWFSRFLAFLWFSSDACYTTNSLGNLLLAILNFLFRDSFLFFKCLATPSRNSWVICCWSSHPISSPPWKTLLPTATETTTEAARFLLDLEETEEENIALAAAAVWGTIFKRLFGLDCWHASSARLQVKTGGLVLFRTNSVSVLHFFASCFSCCSLNCFSKGNMNSLLKRWIWGSESKKICR